MKKILILLIFISFILAGCSYNLVAVNKNLDDKKTNDEIVPSVLNDFSINLDDKDEGRIVPNVEEIEKEAGRVVRYGIVKTFSTSGDMRFYYYDIEKGIALDNWQGYPWFFATPENLNDGEKIDDLYNYVENNQNSVFKIIGTKEKDDCDYYDARTCLENITIKEIKKVD
ncbi:hypothetical protein KJ586_00755 [Patescibacteria group bacterium]|nr:hypothetical protein [Patescibacteria group bacterium]MBU4347511.1 hypothetical protein [Patescibacteria group bacterium]MBU4455027.1 hypothetical protein [Patescibacteria group bacterium]MCG2690794.1 hypothetical protein [Candidatus Parcubacteria bacterium]